MKLMLIFVLTMLKETEINALVKQIFDEIRFTQEPAGLYDPLRYMIEIGGKRIRPRLCLTTYSFYSDTIDESIFSPAAALEVFHSFTLMHGAAAGEVVDRSGHALHDGTDGVGTCETLHELVGDVARFQ